jgi:S-adenosylmethionine:tRNA ribosyltransferase-isomerase
VKLSDFDFELPPELIAQHPPRERQLSRMLVMSRETGICQSHPFTDIASFLEPGDCLVINNTRVIPARLMGYRDSGGKVEALLLEEVSPQCWKCMLRPGRRLHEGEKITFESNAEYSYEIVRRRDDGTFEIRFSTEDVIELLEQHGHIPLPPYIRREAGEQDRARYQTVYAQHPGAVAAPTAGLHFTPEIMDELKSRGVDIAPVTLHVGPGTFQPVKVENLDQHQMHEEAYYLSAESAELINRAKDRGHRVVAIGTTSVRVLETCADPATGRVVAGQGRTRIFLYPPKRPVVTDALLTNFHLPKSTLIMLVSTFSSVENVLKAYQVAVQEKMRFYSYGDCMLLI